MPHRWMKVQPDNVCYRYTRVRFLVIPFAVVVLCALVIAVIALAIQESVSSSQELDARILFSQCSSGPISIIEELALVLSFEVGAWSYLVPPCSIGLTFEASLLAVEPPLLQEEVGGVNSTLAALRHLQQSCRPSSLDEASFVNASAAAEHDWQERYPQLMVLQSRAESLLAEFELLDHRPECQFSIIQRDYGAGELGSGYISFFTSPTIRPHFYQTIPGRNPSNLSEAVLPVLAAIRNSTSFAPLNVVLSASDRAMETFASAVSQYDQSLSYGLQNLRYLIFIDQLVTLQRLGGLLLSSSNYTTWAPNFAPRDLYVIMWTARGCVDRLLYRLKELQWDRLLPQSTATVDILISQLLPQLQFMSAQLNLYSQSGQYIIQTFVDICTATEQCSQGSLESFFSNLTSAVAMVQTLRAIAQLLAAGSIAGEKWTSDRSTALLVMLGFVLLISMSILLTINSCTHLYQKVAMVNGELHRRKTLLRFLMHELRVPLNSVTIGLDILDAEEMSDAPPSPLAMKTNSTAAQLAITREERGRSARDVFAPAPALLRDRKSSHGSLLLPLEKESDGSEDLLSHLLPNRDVVSLMKTSCSTVQIVLDSILEIEKLSEGLFKPQPGLTPLRSEITSIIDTLRIAASIKGVHISAELQACGGSSEGGGGEESLAELDPRVLRLALQNLLSNAVKFSPPGGEVRVETSILPLQSLTTASALSTAAGSISKMFSSFLVQSAESYSEGSKGVRKPPIPFPHADQAATPAEESALRTDLEWKRCLLTITVSDNGKGIASSEVGNLFRPFSQLVNAESAISGSGLGLYIARSLVRAHGGDILLIDDRAGAHMGAKFSMSIECIVKTRPAKAAQKKPLIAGDAAAAAAAAAATEDDALGSSFHPKSPALRTSLRANLCSTIHALEAREQQAPRESYSSVESFSIVMKGVTSFPLKDGDTLEEESKSSLKTNLKVETMLNTPYAAKTAAAVILEENSQMSTHASRERALNLTGVRCLIVDDDKATRMLLQRLLTILGATSIVCCGNGQEALEAIFGEDFAGSSRGAATETCRPQLLEISDGGAISPPHPFDVILLDRNMPVLNGVEVARISRVRGFTGIIVGISGDSLQEDSKTFVDAGLSALLSKPINMTRISNLLSKMLLKA